MTGEERDAILKLNDVELSDQCEFDFIKGSGKGGQHRNKTASAVRVRHRPTGLAATDCSERSQHRNRAAALRKLRLKIAFSFRNENPRRPERSRCAPAHPDYPLFAARLLDLLAAAGWQLKPAAAELGLSASALNKLLFRDGDLYGRVNAERQKLELPPLCHP